MISHAGWMLAGFAFGALAVIAFRTVLLPEPAIPTPQMQPTEQAAPAGTPAMTARASAVPGTAAAAVNTVCALCGMPVDPAIPIAMYQGKPIGFGCRACPARFAADPDAYGPSALRNEVAP